MTLLIRSLLWTDQPNQPSNIVWVVKRRVPLLPEQVVATKNTEAEADAECEVIRRGLASIGIGLAIAAGFWADTTVAQKSSKPEIKISEARPIISEYVEKMSIASKRNTGVEFTAQQKTKLIDSILDTMKDQNVYAFVDP